MFRLRLGLRSKFTLLVTVLLIVVFSIQSYVLFTRHLEQARSTLSDEVKTYTTLSTLPVGSSYDQYYESGHFRFGEIIQQVIDNSNTTITRLQLFDTEGALLFDTKFDLSLDKRENIAYRTTPPKPNAAKGQLLNQLQKIDPSFNVKENKETETIVYPVLNEYNKHQYSIVYFVSYQRIYDSLYKNLLSFTIVAAVSLIAASILITIFVGFSTLKPIGIVAKDIQKIEKGDLSHTIVVKTHDEIEDLALSINHMSQSLLRSQEILKQDRDTIAAERNTLSTVLGSIGDGVIALNDYFEILLFNTAASIITGWSNQDVEEKKLDTVFLFSEKGIIIPARELCQSVESLPLKRRLTFKTKNNQEKTIDMVVSPVPEIYATKLRYILSFYDVSKEEELEKLKVDFVSIATHELRTPLTSIKGYLSVFIKENSSMFNADQNMFLDRINTSILRLSNLVENLLSVARIEKGNLTLNFSQAVNWQVFIEQIVEELKPQAAHANLNLYYEKPSLSHPPPMVDTMRIYEVLINLIANAINYTPAGGTIKVWSEYKGDSITTHIKDTGKGIPKEAIPNLFQKFFRVVNTYEQGSKGTGLGLYISKSIIELHHGKIWVESEEGKGSTFSFSLPLSQ